MNYTFPSFGHEVLCFVSFYLVLGSVLLFLWALEIENQLDRRSIYFAAWTGMICFYFLEICLKGGML